MRDDKTSNKEPAKVKSGESDTTISHVDYTTLIGAIDALGLIKQTQNLPLHWIHIFTLAQFIEEIVLMDSLQYESTSSSGWEPYQEILNDSGIQGELTPNLLKPSQNVHESEQLKFDSLCFAIDRAKTVNPADLASASIGRDQLYRAAEIRYGIIDKINPQHAEAVRLLRSYGDQSLIAKYESLRDYLERISQGSALHVLRRIHILNSWIAGTPNTTYAPHLFRTGLQTMMARTQVKSFHLWTLDQIKTIRREYLERNAPTEYSDISWAISPIFLACLYGGGGEIFRLKKAKSPADVLNNALVLRDRWSAKSFRKIRRAAEGKDRQGTQQGVERERLQFVKSLEADISSTRFAVMNALTYMKTHLGFGRTGGAFVFDVLRLTKGVVDAQTDIENVFGPLEGKPDQALFSGPALTTFKPQGCEGTNKVETMDR